MVSSIFLFLPDIFDDNKSATFGGDKEYQIQSDELTVIERGCDQVKRSYKMTNYFSTRRYIGQKHSSGEVGFSRTMGHSRRTLSDV